MNSRMTPVLTIVITFFERAFILLVGNSTIEPNPETHKATLVYSLAFYP